MASKSNMVAIMKCQLIQGNSNATVTAILEKYLQPHLIMNNCAHD